MRRIQCLKYLVLATMLNQSDVDPFDAQVWTAWPTEQHCRCCRGAKHAQALMCLLIIGRRRSRIGMTQTSWR